MTDFSEWLVDLRGSDPIIDVEKWIRTLICRLLQHKWKATRTAKGHYPYRNIACSRCGTPYSAMNEKGDIKSHEKKQWSPSAKKPSY